MALKKIAFNMDEELLRKVDEYAAKIHINRTAAISVILSLYLDGLQAAHDMSELLAQTKNVKTIEEIKTIEG